MATAGLTKIIKQHAKKQQDPGEQSVLERATELVRILQRPSVAAAVLGRSGLETTVCDPRCFSILRSLCDCFAALQFLQFESIWLSVQTRERICDFVFERERVLCRDVLDGHQSHDLSMPCTVAST
jgi:hypothetical protein